MALLNESDEAISFVTVVTASSSQYNKLVHLYLLFVFGNSGPVEFGG